MVCFDHKRSLALIFFHIAEKFSKQSEIIEELKSERVKIILKINKFY